jgi:hypothetical protein
MGKLTHSSQIQHRLHDLVLTNGAGGGGGPLEFDASPSAVAPAQQHDYTLAGFDELLWLPVGGMLQKASYSCSSSANPT